MFVDLLFGLHENQRLQIEKGFVYKSRLKKCNKCKRTKSKMNFTATFHVFNIQGYSQEKLKKIPMRPQNTGHKPNGTTRTKIHFSIVMV